MHRSRPTALVIVAAAVAACSTHDDTKGTDLLSQDRTLVARLEIDHEGKQAPLPAACGTLHVPAQPAVGNQHQAEELTRQARNAEIQGNLDEARTLLRRATDLDATNKTAAYHLGRTSEALGDRASAMTAYCRYLALTPTNAEAVEAREHVAALSKTATHVSAGSVVDSVARQGTTARVTRAPSTAPARTSVASAIGRRTTPAPVARRAPEPERVATTGATAAPVPSRPAASAPQAEASTASGASGGEVSEAPATTPSEERPAQPTTVRRGPSRAQGAIIGTAAGAIIGAASGRSVRSAVIGAAAGGIIGTVMARPPMTTGTWR